MSDVVGPIWEWVFRHRTLRRVMFFVLVGLTLTLWGPLWSCSPCGFSSSARRKSAKPSAGSERCAATTGRASLTRNRIPFPNVTAAAAAVSDTSPIRCGQWRG